MTAPQARTILIVEDDVDTRANLRDILEADDYSVEVAGSITEALARDSWERLEFIILDRKLPDGNVEDALREMRLRAPDASTLIVTGYTDLTGVITALREGADDYLLKPVNPELLKKALGRLWAIKEAQRKAKLAARLAAVGEMVAGLAHESRNALQRSQACLELLELEIADRPEAVDLVRRIQKAQDHLHRLFEELRSYVAPIQLDRTPCSVSELWREAWQLLQGHRAGRDITLRESGELQQKGCCCDRFRMVQVFRNILENALAACKDPVVVDVTCGNARLGDRDAIQISVRDNGDGLNSEQRKRIFEPFYTTKTHGTGLGMAIANRIVESHGGRLFLGDPAPRDGLAGAEIILLLPRDDQPRPDSVAAVRGV
jgi:signal transduction histidine kinase